LKGWHWLLGEESAEQATTEETTAVTTATEWRVAAIGESARADAGQCEAADHGDY
jgi:hypothetical protein